MLENWCVWDRHGTASQSNFFCFRCWEPKVLEQMSSHHETKEPLSAELIGKIIKRCVTQLLCWRASASHAQMRSLFHSRFVNNGLFHLRQLFFSKFDVEVHTNQGKSIFHHKIIQADQRAFSSPAHGRHHGLHRAVERTAGEDFAGQVGQSNTRSRFVCASHQWVRCRVLRVRVLAASFLLNGQPVTVGTRTRSYSLRTCTQRCSRATR